MQKSPNQHLQSQKQLHPSFRSVSFLLLSVLIIASVTINTYHVVRMIFNSPKILRPAVSVETGAKATIVSNVETLHTTSLRPFYYNYVSEHHIGKSKAIISPRQTQSQPKVEQKYLQPKKSAKPTIYDSRIFNTSISLMQPQKQKNKLLFYNQTQSDIILPPKRQSLLTFKQTKQSPINFKLTTERQVYQTQTATALIFHHQFAKAENIRKQNQQQSLPTNRALTLQISDIVALVLQNNRTIKNAYLERISQRQDLAVEEDKFAPDITPTLSMSLGESGSSAISTVTNQIGLEAKMKIPTGGELSFGWTDNALRPKITFNQPLLRGAGVDMNRASIQTARLTEKTNILGLKSTLTNTITEAILAYRNLLRAQEQLKIEQLSLKSAQELLEINKALIAAGRLAPVEIIQSETAIANRQVSLVTAQNSLESTKLALLQLLDIDKNINIMAAEVPKVSPVILDPNKLRQVALLNQPEYLQAQLNLDKAKLDLLQAKNNRRWDLGLNISYDNTTGNNTTSDVKAGLTFSKTLGDPAPEQRFQRSRVNLLQTENNLKEQLESLEIQVTDRIRDVNSSFYQVQLAQQARKSSERQLEIEREKQRLGRGSGVFEIVSLENSLVEARNAELNAIIEYLNTLTNLDRSIGITLDTWQVKIETRQK